MKKRSNKDRRKHIDPRYQDAAYPECIERRKGGDRRKVSYQDFPGHPNRKSIMFIGLVVTVFLICVFFTASFVLTKKCHYETVQKKTITFGYHQDHQESHKLVAIV
jgi:hypothetical protein